MALAKRFLLRNSRLRTLIILMRELMLSAGPLGTAKLTAAGPECANEYSHPSAVYNLFNLGRHLISARHYRALRHNAFAFWERAVAA